MADFDFSTLITDRSAADLELLRDLLSTPMSEWTAEQLAAFNQAISKGAYNYTDLNRVTACMEYLDETLRAYGYRTGYQRIVVHPEEPPLDPYTWYEADTPRAYQMSRYLQNVSKLRETLTLPEGTLEVPDDMVGLTQTEANNIERILGIIETWIQNMMAAWFYSGDLYAGEV